MCDMNFVLFCRFVLINYCMVRFPDGNYNETESIYNDLLLHLLYRVKMAFSTLQVRMQP